jgi:hypothetical protein
VTSLEPRTPHQPGKLQKLSKNEYLFTLSIFRVNEKRGTVSSDFSIECRWFTGGCSGDGAVLWVTELGDVRGGAIFGGILSRRRVALREQTLIAFVKIQATPRWTGHSRRFFSQRTLRPFAAVSAFQGVDETAIIES